MNDLKWNGKEIISFLNIFQNYPCLWDVQSNSNCYLNRNVKDVSYKKLLEDLRIAKIPGTPESISNKIKSLRDIYRKKLDEIQKSSDGSNEICKSRLIWFSAAEVFCFGSVTGGESSSNLDFQKYLTPEDEEDTANYADSESDSCMNSQSDSENDSENYSQSDFESDSEHSTIDAALQKKNLESQSLVVSLQSASTSLSTPTRKRPPLKMLPPQLEKILKRQPQHEELPSKFEKTVTKLQQRMELFTADAEDQYDTFSKHLASQLRELPIRSFIFLQSKIQSLISEERIAYLNSSTIPSQSQDVDMSSQNSTTLQNFDSKYCEFENTLSETSDTSCYIEEGDTHGHSQLSIIQHLK